MRRRALPAALALAGAALAAASAYRLGATAWPEIVTPAWFVTRGLVLYDAIFFPHTPLLILLTAALGGAFGFSAAVLRAVPALALAACGALVVLGTRPGRASGAAAGLLAGVPSLVLLTVYTEGPALWPEPFLAPFFLLGALLLERHARLPRAAELAAAGLVFGAAILVKQTAAWPALAAVAWLLVRRASPRDVAAFAGAVAAPYALFLAGWGAAFRTFAHARWTLLHPLFSGMGREIAQPPDAAGLHEGLLVFVPFAALALLERALPGPRRFSPAAAVGLACLGMAWPRWGLLHLAGATGLAALALARAAALAVPVLRVAFRRATPRGRLAAGSLGAAALAVAAGVLLFGAGPLVRDAAGRPLLYWDDADTRAAAARVAARVAPGGALLVYGVPRETLYPLTGTVAPGRLYVNPTFWYCLNKDGVDGRLAAALRAAPGLPILYREPTVDAAQVRATATYAFIRGGTRPDGPAGDAQWRVVAPGGR